MQYINEAKRMQFLAGIITEAEAIQNQPTTQDPEANKDAEQGLKAALNLIKSGTDSLKQSPKDGQIDEAAGLVFGLVAGAPGLINLTGKAVNGIASIFQKDKKKGTVVGNALKKWGHQLEDAYIETIASALIAVYPDTFKNQSVQNKQSELYKSAKHIYGSILVAAAMASGMGALNASNLVLSGLEGGLAAFKTAEVVQMANKIGAV